MTYLDCLSAALGALRVNAMGSTEAKQELGAIVGNFRGPGGGRNRIHYRRSWRLIANAAFVVLLLSCALVNSGLAEEN